MKFVIRTVPRVHTHNSTAARTFLIQCTGGTRCTTKQRVKDGLGRKGTLDWNSIATLPGVIGTVLFNRVNTVLVLYEFSLKLRKKESG